VPSEVKAATTEAELDRLTMLAGEDLVNMTCAAKFAAK
jgi:hypothetical protein